MSTRALLASSIVVLMALSGCASQTDKYCGQLKDDKQTLIDLAQHANRPGSDRLVESLTVFEELRDAAPDDVVDEWNTFVFAWQDLADAFDQAGIDPGDYRPGKKSPGVNDAEAKAIEGAARELGSDRVTSAGNGIEQHARDVCKVDLGL